MNRDHPAATEARTRLSAAVELAAAGRADAAEAAANEGLEILGETYLDPDRPPDDDTGLKVLIAGRTADVQVRATLLRRALAARLVLYQQRFAADGFRFHPSVDEG